MPFARSLITVDYFRYHIDDTGEQKEAEWGCHDYCDLSVFLYFHLKISLNF